jgi:transposase
MSKTVIRYSESFKLKVVNELESGILTSYSEARSLYGIKGCNTVQYWIRKYGKNHLLNKVVRVEKADEQCEIKRYKKRIQQLEKALVDAHLDLSIERSYVEIACEAANITDINTFKKKADI